MLQKGKTYHRHDPGGHIATVEIVTDADVKYHQGLVDKGYRYTLIDFNKPQSAA